MAQHLNGISEIRSFFRTNTQPIYFVGPTAFNLLGIDRWVRNFQYVVYYDSWDGAHPRMFAPKNRPYVEFESSEQINNYLLRDPEVQDHLTRRGGTPMVVMVFFDEETEEICKRARLQPDPAAGLASTPARFQDRDHPARQRGRRPVGAERARHRRHLGRARRRSSTGNGLGHRPGRPDAVRRLRQDHVLHQVREGLGRRTPRTSSASS